MHVIPLVIPKARQVDIEVLYMSIILRQYLLLCMEISNEIVSKKFDFFWETKFGNLLVDVKILSAR